MFEKPGSKKEKMHNIEHHARELADNIEALLESLEGEQQRPGGRDREDHRRYQEKMRHMKGQAREKWSQARDTAWERGQQIDRYAHENVWKTVMMAAGLGALIGSLFMNKRDRRRWRGDDY